MKENEQLILTLFHGHGHGHGHGVFLLATHPTLVTVTVGRQPVAPGLIVEYARGWPAARVETVKASRSRSQQLVRVLTLVGHHDAINSLESVAVSLSDGHGHRTFVVINSQ